MSYQWQRRGVGTGWADVPGATEAVLTLRGIDPPLGGEQYRVVAIAAGVSVVVRVGATAAGLVRMAVRRGKVRVERVVAVTEGSAQKVTLPRRLTRKAGKLVVQVTLTPTARTDLPSRSTLYTVVRR